MASRPLVAWCGALLLLTGCAGFSTPARDAATERARLVEQGRRIFADRRCVECHTVGVVGTPIAADLARVGLRYREADLARWLRDPSAQKPTRHMPSLELNEADARALAAYLASLQ